MTNKNIIIALFIFSCLSAFVSTQKILGKGYKPVYVPVKGNNYVFGQLVHNNATIFDEKGEIKTQFNFGSVVTTYPNFLGLKDGNFLITWRGLSMNIESDYIQKFDLDGHALTNPIELDTGHISSQTQGNSIIQLKDDGYVVMWHTAKKVGNLLGNFTAFVQIFNKNDSPRTQKIQVFQSFSTLKNFPVQISLENGDFVVIWSEDVDGVWTIYGQSYNANGVKGNRFIIHKGTNLAIRIEHITTLQSGDLLLTWIRKNADSASHSLYAQVIRPDGIVEQPEFFVKSAPMNEATTTVQSAILQNGKFVIAWSEYVPNSALYFQLYDSNSQPYKAAIKVAGGGGGIYDYPYITAGQDGGFLILWSYYTAVAGHIYLQKFDGEGNPVFHQNEEREKLFLSI